MFNIFKFYRNRKRKSKIGWLEVEAKPIQRELAAIAKSTALADMWGGLAPHIRTVDRIRKRECLYDLDVIIAKIKQLESEME